MLTKLNAALALCVALTITPLTASPAYAEGGCEGASWGVACGVGVPGYGGSGPAAPLKNTHSGSSDPVACVTQEMPPREVACSDAELGTWSNARACYIKAESPPPPLTDAVWSGPERPLGDLRHRHRGDRRRDHPGLRPRQGRRDPVGKRPCGGPGPAGGECEVSAGRHRSRW